MSAQPIEDPQDDPLHDPYDPRTTLDILPEKHHEFFLAEYAKAWQDAWNPQGYREFRKFLRKWRHLAITYADPSYEDDRAAAREGRGNWIPIEDMVPNWPFKFGTPTSSRPGKTIGNARPPSVQTIVAP